MLQDGICAGTSDLDVFQLRHLFSRRKGPSGRQEYGGVFPLLVGNLVGHFQVTELEPVVGNFETRMLSAEPV